MNNETFTTYEMVEILGIPRSSIKQYLERQFISPSVEVARGKGSKNLFSLTDLYQVRIFQRLHACGITQREASEWVRSFDSSKVNSGWLKWLFVQHAPELNLIPYSSEEELLEGIRNRKTDTFTIIDVSKLIGDINKVREKKGEGKKEKVRVIRIGNKYKK